MELWFERFCVKAMRVSAVVCESSGVKAEVLKSSGVWDLRRVWAGCVWTVVWGNCSYCGRPVVCESCSYKTILWSSYNYPSFYPFFYPFLYPFSPLSFSLSFYLPLHPYHSLFSFYPLFYLFVGCRISSILKNFSPISDILYYRTDSQLVWHTIIRNRAHSQIVARRYQTKWPDVHTVEHRTRMQIFSTDSLHTK